MKIILKSDLVEETEKIIGDNIILKYEIERKSADVWESESYTDSAQAVSIAKLLVRELEKEHKEFQVSLLLT